MAFKQFGGKITPQWKSKYTSSPNWKGGKFQNLMDTQTALNFRQFPTILYKQIKGHKEGYPKDELPILPFDKEAFLKPSADTRLVWYGHSVMLMRMKGQTILIDPMLGDDASPIGPIKTKRFSNNTLGFIDDFPEIDLVVITHDHYDHLDFASIMKLKAKAKHFFVALGVKRHLESWGIDSSKIEEFDWWDSKTFNEIQITFTPTRHFSGRGLTSLAKCLWGGWAFKTDNENIWFSGDSGYAEHFKEVGSQLGPFDFAMMECGQYCVDWPEIHMFPEESVNAAIDAKVKKVMPVHWAGFNLSYYHAWYEPADVFHAAAVKQNLEYTLPNLGQVFGLADTYEEKWWM